MEDNEVNLWAVKLATLEILVKALYVEFFRRQSDPIARANDYAELFRQRVAENPPAANRQDERLALEENLK